MTGRSPDVNSVQDSILIDPVLLKECKSWTRRTDIDEKVIRRHVRILEKRWTSGTLNARNHVRRPTGPSNSDKVEKAWSRF